MSFKDIKVIKAVEGPVIKELKEGFHRMIFYFSETPPIDWVSFFSENYNSIKSIDRVIETISSIIIVQCQLKEIQSILDDFKKASSYANEKYKNYLSEKEKKNEIMRKKYLEEKKKVDESIGKLNFD